LNVSEGLKGLSNSLDSGVSLEKDQDKKQDQPQNTKSNQTGRKD
jgi:hypothetical protein